MTEVNNEELIQKINYLKQKKNVVILAHNYQRGEVQDIADFVGDSLELSQKAAETDADMILFCGVHFMAETASILCPEKKVLLPDSHAGCPMANMITVEELLEEKKKHPKAKVVCYVNSSAEVKAESDICCTSANAVKVVESVAAEEILFIPDEYLGRYVATQSRKKLIFWPGFCPTHAKIQVEDILNLKKKYPFAVVMVHPECRPDVIALADQVLSTGGMLRFAHETDAREIIVGTEMGIIHRLKKENAAKEFIAVTKTAVCPNMKLVTLEKMAKCLEAESPEVKVPEDIRIRAKASVDRMLAVGNG
jgi:quinolinate synthase